MDSKIMNVRGNSSFQIAATDTHGNETNLVVSSDMQIEKIKEMIVKQLSLEAESASSYSQYKLVLAQEMPRSLCDDKTAKQETLEDGDSILLIKSRSAKQPVSSLVKDGLVSHDGPTQTAIARATEGLPSLGEESEPKVPSSSSDLSASSPSQVEQTLRRVLLALLELSYKFVEFDRDSSVPKNSDINPDQLKSLTEMGFSEAHSIRALRLNNHNQQQATEWVLNHQESQSGGEVGTSNGQRGESMEVSASSRPRRSTRSFKANPAHLATLMDMGFSEQDSIQALKANGNNPNSACEWLLSDRPMESDDEAGDEPLNPNSELYKALVSNPTIHIGLHDRKVLEALEDMVENPWRRNNWAYESAVGNVILQILKLYNKYSTTAPQN